MGIYTKTGDAGETLDLSGQKVSKNDVMIHFAGAADELNSHLGLIKAMLPDNSTRQFIEEIQKNIMKMISHISDTANSQYRFCEDEVSVLEKEIDKLSEQLPQQFHFILPGRNVTEAHIHIARTIARSAERQFFAVSEKLPLCPHAGVYLNRLSDYLFVLALAS